MSSRPEASTSNWDRPGQTRANTALVRLSDDGAVRIWVSAATHVVVDVAGAFVPATESRAGRYVPIAPQRVVDTRSSGAPDPGRPITVALPAEVPADALALAVNLTLTETTGFDFVAASAAGSAPPATSVLNADGAGQTRAAGAIVPVSPGGIAIDGRVRERRHRRRRRLLHGRVVGELRRGSVRSGDADASARHPVRRATRSTTVARARSTWCGATGGPVAAVVANWTLTQTTRAGWLATYPSRTITRRGVDDQQRHRRSDRRQPRHRAGQRLRRDRLLRRWHAPRRRRDRLVHRDSGGGDRTGTAGERPAGAAGVLPDRAQRGRRQDGAAVLAVRGRCRDHRPDCR